MFSVSMSLFYGKNNRSGFVYSKSVATIDSERTQSGCSNFYIFSVNKMTKTFPIRTCKNGLYNTLNVASKGKKRIWNLFVIPKLFLFYHNYILGCCSAIDFMCSFKFAINMFIQCVSQKTEQAILASSIMTM